MSFQRFYSPTHLNLKNAFAFKRAFGNQAYPDHLIGLIKTITGREYDSIEILNPYSSFDPRGSFNIEEDLHAVADNGDYYIIILHQYCYPAFLKDTLKTYHRYRSRARTRMQGDHPSGSFYVIVLTDFNIRGAQTDACMKWQVIDGEIYELVDEEGTPTQGKESLIFFSLHSEINASTEQIQLQRLFNGLLPE